MIILALDIGGKSRNGFCLMNTDTKHIIRHSFLTYDTKMTPLYHRQKVLKEVLDYYYNTEQYIDALVFERINLFRSGSVSPLSNIVSLCKLQTTLIDNLSDMIPIYDVPVRSWKARSLPNGAKSGKEDSVNCVLEMYPFVDLKIPKYSTKDPDAFVYNHDLADAIMIAVAISDDPGLLNNKVNYN